MHKDLSDKTRFDLTQSACDAADVVELKGESLALAREVWLNAFDRMAEELDEAN
jgi:hypothetical protein